MNLKYIKNKISLTLIVALISITFCRAQTTWIVENLSDSPGVTKSLRWTIALASAGDTIKFLSTLDNGTITLLQGEIEIDKNLTIIGTSHFGITIDANNTSRIFNLNALTNYWPSSKLKVGITKLNLINGYSNASGGAIFCSIGSQLKIFNCSFISNSISTDGTYSVRGGAISGGQECKFIIHNSIFEDNKVLLSTSATNPGIVLEGGAISNNHNSSNSTIRNCTFNSNYAYSNGGAIEATGHIRIGQSLFQNNKTFVAIVGSSGGSGGAIYSSGAEQIGIHNSRFLGGDAYIGSAFRINFAKNTTISNCELSYNNSNAASVWITESNNTSIINCTISNNIGKSGAAIIMRGGNLDITNCTIAFNSAFWEGAGIFIGSSVLATNITLKNSIIANNIASSSPKNDISGNFISNGYNIIGDTTGGIITPTTGDLFNIDPMLFPLADNGGQSRTHAFNFSSPAFEGGVVTGLSTFDQRGIGYDRAYGLTTDIGAYEHQASLPIEADKSMKCKEDNFWNCISLKSYQEQLTNETLDASLISVYPNPTKGVFNIKGLNGSATVSIYDINGKLLAVYNHYTNANINISSFKSGVYLIKIKTENFLVTKRLVRG